MEQHRKSWEQGQDQGFPEPRLGDVRKLLDDVVNEAAGVIGREIRGGTLFVPSERVETAS